ncbi:serine O-acetyltransferase [Paenibacillus durus]|nr:serine acetyltransferase [Paenibacillus durus]
MSSINDNRMNRLVAEIAASYREQPINPLLDYSLLPSRKLVIESIHLVWELLFPGYFGKQDLNDETLEYHIGSVLIQIQEKLTDQIGRSLLYRRGQDSHSSQEVRPEAEEIIHQFLAEIPRIRSVLATDAQIAFDGDPAANDLSEIIFSYPGLFAVGIYRMAHELEVLSVPLIPRIMTEYAHSVTGIDIHPGAKIGSSFFIDHGTGVVIGETTVIGNRVKIYHGVTLGALSLREGHSMYGKKRHPTLEDDVTVYSGASILGGDTVIGKGVVIGSNVSIFKSVPAGAKVTVKNPELIIKGQAPQEFPQEFIWDWVI